MGTRRDHTFLWFQAAGAARDDELPVLLAAAEDHLGLDEIASGPAHELGLGEAWGRHRALDFLLPRFDEHPALGGPVVRAALRSPVIRNRHGALRGVEAWGPRADPTVREAVAEVAASDPDEGMHDHARTLIAAAR